MATSSIFRRISRRIHHLVQVVDRRLQALTASVDSIALGIASLAAVQRVKTSFNYHSLLTIDAGTQVNAVNLPFTISDDNHQVEIVATLSGYFNMPAEERSFDILCEVTLDGISQGWSFSLTIYSDPISAKRCYGSGSVVVRTKIPAGFHTLQLFVDNSSTVGVNPEIGNFIINPGFGNANLYLQETVE